MATKCGEKLKGKALWEYWRDNQRQWIEDCGGSLAGYVANYPTRTFDNVLAIYRADVAYLEKINRRLADFR